MCIRLNVRRFNVHIFILDFVTWSIWSLSSVFVNNKGFSRVPSYLCNGNLNRYHTIALVRLNENLIQVFTKVLRKVVVIVPLTMTCTHVTVKANLDLFFLLVGFSYQFAPSCLFDQLRCLESIFKEQTILSQHISILSTHWIERLSKFIY